MAGPKTAPRLYCNMCSDHFATRDALLQHMAGHREPTPEERVCETCKWSFDDTVALEKHHMISGHGVPPFPCDNCDELFLSDAALSHHRKSCRGKPVHCDSCHVQFSSEVAYNKHRRFPSHCADNFTKPFKAKEGSTKPALKIDTAPQHGGVLRYEDDPPYERSVTPSDVDGIWCHECRRTFKSQADFDRHILMCFSRRTADDMKITAPAPPAEKAQPLDTVSRLSQEAPSMYDALHHPPPAKAAMNRPAPPPEQVQPPAAVSRPSQQAPSMYDALHHAPPVKGAVSRPAQTLYAPPTKKAVASSQSCAHNAIQSRPAPSKPQTSVSAVPPKETTSVRQPAAAKDKCTPVPASSNAVPPKAATVPDYFPCDLEGACNRVCKSAAALKAHKQDVHGVGGRHSALSSSQPGKLTARAQDQLRSQGLLRPRAPSPKKQAAPRNPPAPPRPVSRQAPRPGPPAPPPVPRAAPVGQAPPPRIPGAAPPFDQIASETVGGQAEYDQAKLIYGRIARLRIQSDITIQHDGKLLCGGIAWTRIGVAKQSNVVEMFEKFTHLPTKLQLTEYLPAPKTFKDTYTAHYPAEDFQHSPDRRLGNAALGIVALSCTKILLDNGCQEAVKIAAVDVLTCRILMDFLVCTDPKELVKDWRPRVTGLSNISNLEDARQAGYKILKGWKAARAALWAFVDKETTIVGYNLRADLDVLRMIHGRAVDITKVVEKAAAGPLSRGQLSLDSLCREFPGVILNAHPKYGRDCLLDAFAIREFGLWVLKQGDEMVRKAKSKSREYQILA